MKVSLDFEIIDTTKDYVVCVKPVGVSSESNGKDGMPELLQKHLGGEIFVVHRLDKNVSGLMVFARNRASAARLSAQIASGKLKKGYVAVCHGVPGSGEMNDLLFKDSSRQKSFVVKRMRKGVRSASLRFKTEKTFSFGEGEGSIVSIELLSGRFHQIRAQFSSRGFPLFGDGKYGAKDRFHSPLLFSARLEFFDEGSEEIRKYELVDLSTHIENLLKILKF